jgi:hypothetical protein
MANQTPSVLISAGLFGAYGYFRNPSAEFIYDASYVKLREASLTYTFPAGLMKKLHPVKAINLSLIGIQQGAKYERHWAFAPPKKVALPKVNNEKWIKNEIDYFTLSKMESKVCRRTKKLIKSGY